MSYHGLAVATIIMYVLVLVLLGGLVFFWFRLRQLARLGLPQNEDLGEENGLDGDRLPAGLGGGSNTELQQEVEQLRQQLAFTELELEKISKEYETLYQKTQGESPAGE